jgi:hypothetical protein
LTLFGLEHDTTPGPGRRCLPRELLAAMQAWRPLFHTHGAISTTRTGAIPVDLLRELLPLVAEMPLVLLCVLRAERQAPAWQIKTTADDAHHHQYLELTLRPLSEAESNELINRLLAVAELPDRLRANILGGKPVLHRGSAARPIDNGVVVPEPAGTRRPPLLARDASLHRL